MNFPVNSFVYILLPVHNRVHLTRNFISCLKKQTFQNFKLILIDDGSTDATVEMVKSNFNDCIVLKGNGNWWWARCLQEGYKWLKGIENTNEKYVLIMNDDTEFENNFLEKFVEMISKMPETFLLAPAYSMENSSLIDQGVYFDFKNFILHKAETQSQIAFLSTRGLIMHLKDFLDSNGFRYKLLPHYYSDYEFTYRAKKNGMQLYAAPDIKLFLNQKSTGIRQLMYNNLHGFIRSNFSIR